MTFETMTQFPDPMLFLEGETCVSLYQPTHRHFPDNKKDPIVFKNLLRELENSLDKLNDKALREKLLAPFYALQEDQEFWMNTMDGIALLTNAERAILYHLHVPVEQLALVARNFHIKPLLRAFQSVEYFQALVLSRDSFSLFEGNQNSMEELPLLEGAPRTMEDALGGQLTPGHITFGAYDGAGETPMYHGYVDTQNEIDKDTERYFRVVADFVQEQISEKSHLPLVLVTLPEHQALFRRVNKNRWLMKEAVAMSAQDTSSADIRQSIHALIARLEAEKISKIKENYHTARADKLASPDVGEISQAAVKGRVGTLLLEQNRIEPGVIQRATGFITRGEASSPYFDDVLDDLAQIVLQMGGEVMMLKPADMPEDTGAAAIFRY